MAGPCVNCGVNETQVWRKGPYETPILCNACGLHFKAKGTLANYLPKRALQNQSLDLDIEKASESSANLSNQTPGWKNTNLWNVKIPQKKRSFVKRHPPTKTSTPMETPTSMDEFQQQLRNLWESEKEENESSPDNILLFDKTNNFIPSNEIGLGCIRLKTNVTSTNQDGSSA